MVKMCLNKNNAFFADEEGNWYLQPPSLLESMLIDPQLPVDDIVTFLTLDDPN